MTDKNYHSYRSCTHACLARVFVFSHFRVTSLVEPWPEPEIKRWVTENYNVQFDMFSKINVNGSDAHPLFKFLKSEKHGFLTDARLNGTSLNFFATVKVNQYNDILLKRNHLCTRRLFITILKHDSHVICSAEFC
ncbi:hypothetical protein AHF37_07875 [Paragonimus kellicotti]|nr:hypothetical protein AHF37_07875 [Paragonimus kellicotti]